MDTTTVFADLVKWDDNDDGTVTVHGRATSDDLDLDRQVCDPSWLAEAMPRWFETGANVRENHTSLAAGVGKNLEQNGTAWDLTTLVVDPGSVAKVRHGVFKGYSIGIRSPRIVKDASAPGGRICGGDVIEVSLTDRPANPTCKLTLTKALKPGPTSSKAVDTARGLVQVEELHDRSGEPLEALEKALQGYDLVAVQKGNSKAQIKDARKAIALLAGVVQAEAACLADGSGTASCDIDLVMGAIHAIEYFVNREQEAAMAHVELSETPDAAKAAAPSPAPEGAPVVEKAAEPTTETPAATPAEQPVEKAAAPETPDLTELVKALQAQVTDLAGQVTKAMDAPAPGGPVLTRTQQDTNKAAAREGLLVKAAEYEATATRLAGDPSTQRAYRAQAKQLRDQAALTS